MRLWNRFGQVVWWMTFTSAPGSSRPLLRHHFEVWRKRLAKLLGVEYRQVEYVVVDTAEGHGVLHAVVAFPPGIGQWLDFSALGDWWLQIHGARQVKFKRVGRGDGDLRRLSTYLISQYMVRQGDAVDLLGRLSSSRPRLPLARLRRWCWRLWVDRLRAYDAMQRDVSNFDARWREVRAGQVASFQVAWRWLLDSGWTVDPDGARWALLPDWRGGVEPVPV